MSAGVFRPFVELVKGLEFRKVSEFETSAFLDGFPVSSISHMGLLDVGMEEWKEAVRRRVLGLSSTVVLRTACNCERLVDLSDKSLLRGYKVPLLARTVTAARMDYGHDRNTFMERVFRWEDKYHRNGARVLDEVLS